MIYFQFMTMWILKSYTQTETGNKLVANIAYVAFFSVAFLLIHLSPLFRINMPKSLLHRNHHWNKTRIFNSHLIKQSFQIGHCHLSIESYLNSRLHSYSPCKERTIPIPMYIGSNCKWRSVRKVERRTSLLHQLQLK